MTDSANSGQRWSSVMAFFLAATGTAVGLGNIWRFPFLAGENGGGAFLIVYLFAVFAIGVPIMMTELVIGRKTRASGDAAVISLRPEGKGAGVWASIGWLSFIIPFVGIAYYSVVAGWVTDYFGMAVVGLFDGTESRDAGEVFGAMLADPVRLLIGQTLFLVGVTYVVMQGVQDGIERIAKFMMPAFFILLVLLAVYAGFAGDFARGAGFLLTPDFGALTPKTVLLAVGQAFFSLAIGFGIMITFGSYLPREASIFRTAGAIALADTLVAIIAGLMIFPLLFAQGLETNGGPGLILKLYRVRLLLHRLGTLLVLFSLRFCSLRPLRPGLARLKLQLHG